MSRENNRSLKDRLKQAFDLVFAVTIHLLFIAIALLGGLVVYGMADAWRTGEAGTTEAIFFGAFGLLMVVIGVGFFYVAYIGAPRFLANLERRRKKYRDKPWLLNRQWRARRVVHSTKYTAWFMWFWCIGWWGIMGFLWSVNKDLILADLQGTWDQAIPTALPIVVGVIALLVAISVTWRRLRFGDAVMIIDTLPGVLGGEFRGKVMARLKNALTEPVGITLTCGSLRSEKRDVHGSWQTVWITDELWAEKQEFHPTQTTYDKGWITLRVRFRIPADLPESGHILDDPQIVWKLKVRPGSVLDRSLKAEFQVPVFALQENS